MARPKAYFCVLLLGLLVVVAVGDEDEGIFPLAIPDKVALADVDDTGAKSPAPPVDEEEEAAAVADITPSFSFPCATVHESQEQAPFLATSLNIFFKSAGKGGSEAEEPIFGLFMLVDSLMLLLLLLPWLLPAVVPAAAEMPSVPSVIAAAAVTADVV